jgi:putative pyoverdin transport system ATP-binding/permease protein
MFLLRLIRREIQSALARLVAMAVLAGVSNALILAVVNAGAEAATHGQVSLRNATIFILALLTYIKAQDYILATTTLEIEAAIHRLRLRLMDHVRNSELLSLDEIGQAEIIAVVTKETTTLSQAATIMVVAAQGSVLILFTGIYIAYQSLPAFLATVAIVTTATVLYLLRSGTYKAEMHQALESEKALFDRLSDLLNGFKEIRLNKKRSEDLFKDIEDVSTTAAFLKIKSQVAGLRQFTFSQASFYILLGTIVFAVPSFSETLGGSMVKSTTAILFIIGSISSIVQSIPMMIAANASAENMGTLEEALVGAARRNGEATTPRRPFTTIKVSGATFRHIDRRSEATFQIGPINFVLRVGEIVFISGGNGSGKSTFLKLLTGLYPLETGSLTIDGEIVTAANLERYREHFTAVFSDYHLFKRAYGIRNPDPAEVERLLTLFQLNGKTALVNGEFTTVDLSAGQRKRLALIVGLLERRQILVLDEWTADQDPEFRRKFYDELLPALQESGKTVIAVTHDDRYLSELKLAARKLRMEDGRFAAASADSIL